MMNVPCTKLLVAYDYCSVADPEGPETFARIRSGTEINVLDPDSDPDSNPDSNPEPKLDPKKSEKEPYFQAEIGSSYGYTYLTFTSSSNNCSTVENILNPDPRIRASY